MEPLIYKTGTYEHQEDWYFDPMPIWYVFVLTDGSSVSIAAHIMWLPYWEAES